MAYHRLELLFSDVSGQDWVAQGYLMDLICIGRHISVLSQRLSTISLFISSKEGLTLSFLHFLKAITVFFGSTRLRMRQKVPLLYSVGGNMFWIQQHLY